MVPAVPDRPSAGRFLGERWGRVWARPHRSAYEVVSGLFLVLSVVVVFAAGSDPGWPASGQPVLFLPWAAFLVGSLRKVAVARAEPDPPGEARPSAPSLAR